MDAEKPEIKIAVLGGSDEIRRQVIKALINIHGNSKVICDDDYEGSVLSNIKKLKHEPVYPMQKHCDCLNCRLGKINQCQTFRPSKKGKRR